MLRFNSWIGECTNFLEKSSNAAKSDSYLVAWVKLLRITEEIGESFALDDLENVASLSEYRVQLMLRGFEKRLASWKESLPHTSMNGTYHFYSSKPFESDVLNSFTRNHVSQRQYLPTRDRHAQ